MAIRCLVALVALCSAANAQTQQQTCGFDAQSANLVRNGDFEMQSGYLSGRGYTYVQPTMWTKLGAGTRTVIVQNGNGPWGGLSSYSGSFFCALQVAGTGIQQTITGMQVGQLYTFSAKMAERPGYSRNERVTIRLGNQVLFNSYNVHDQFNTAIATFRATSTTATLTITNVGGGGDQTAFVDAVSICPLPPSCALVQNPSFEANSHAGSHAYIAPTGWQTGSPTRTNMARNGNGPWGSLNSGDGGYYLVLQRQGTYVQQTITGLSANNPYTISFLAAERPGYTANERLGVKVNGAFIPGANAINPATVFQPYTVTFTPTTTQATIRFENTGTANQDQSVFVDGVSVCRVATTPAPVATTTTMTTVTTHTFHQIVSNNISDLSGSVSTLTQAVNRITSQIQAMNFTLNQHLTFPSVSTAVATMSTNQQLLQTKVGAIQGAISAAVAPLPRTSNPVLQGTGDPKITRDPNSGNLILNPGAGQVNIQGSCGIFDPCTLYNAVDALRNVPNP